MSRASHRVQWPINYEHRQRVHKAKAAALDQMLRRRAFNGLLGIADYTKSDVEKNNAR